MESPELSVEDGRERYSGEASTTPAPMFSNRLRWSAIENAIGCDSAIPTSAPPTAGK